jgi:AbiV family abortive infection protein
MNIKLKLMDKIMQLYIETSREALENSRLWLEEARQILVERKNYGHALSIILFSIEETIKSWICFTVGIGAMDHNEDIVNELFTSHESKFADALFFYMILIIPLIQKSYSEKLSEQEETHLKKFMAMIGPNYQPAAKQLVSLRSRGIYVDICEGKTLSPKMIPKKQAEAYYMDAIIINKIIETMINLYQNADNEEREELVNQTKKGVKIGLMNWDRIASSFK